MAIRFTLGRDLDAALGHVVENDGPHHDAKHHRDQDVLRKPAGHFLTPVCSGRSGNKFGRFEWRRNKIATLCTLARMFPL